MPIREITDEALERAGEELEAQKKVLAALAKLADPVKRARVVRAVAVLYGLDEQP